MLDRLSSHGDHHRQRREVPGDVSLGRGHVRVPDRGRGRGRRARARASGTASARSRATSATARAARWRATSTTATATTSPSRTTSASTRSGSRSRGRECCPERPGERERRRARLLRPRRRRAARERDRARRDAVPLGPAGGARGCRRLAGARHGRGVQRVRRGGRRPARRPRPALDHAERAVGDRLARLRLRHPRAGPDLDGGRDRRRPPRPALTRSRDGDPAPRGARLAGRSLDRPRGRAVRERCSRGHRGGARLRRSPQPLVPRPGLPRLVSRGRARAPRPARAAGAGRGPRADRCSDRLPRRQLLPAPGRRRSERLGLAVRASGRLDPHRHRLGGVARRPLRADGAAARRVLRRRPS